MNFQTTLQSWCDFSSITGGATTSLVGLLLVIVGAATLGTPTDAVT